jgi:hypothetical protein
LTELSQRPRTAESAAAVVTDFFDRYRAHDVDGMTDLCSMNADFSYVPVELRGKQRVLRGDGKVRTIGKPLWTGLIASFPDLSNTVHTMTSNARLYRRFPHRLAVDTSLAARRHDK